MAPIRSVMVWAMLAIASTVAIPVPNQESRETKLHPFVLPLPDHGINILPSETHPHILMPIDENRHRLPAKPQRIERMKAFFHSHRNSTNVRRQSSVAAKITQGAVQGMMTAGTTLAGDHIADDLTEWEADHSEKAKEDKGKNDE